MATFVFDVDSTILNCESLEIILEKRLLPAQKKQIQTITELGLRGKIPFPESLRKRLAIASPMLADLHAFAKGLQNYLTQGMPDLLGKLHSQGHEIWLLSGGLKESLAPLPSLLGLPAERLIAVQLLWSDKGECLGLDPDDPNSHSKAAAAALFAPGWPSPRMAIGDAVSDYRLYEEGLVDDFILYTEHFRCTELLQKGVKEARDVLSLQERLKNGRFLF